MASALSSCSPPVMLFQLLLRGSNGFRSENNIISKRYYVDQMAAADQTVLLRAVLCGPNGVRSENNIIPGVVMQINWFPIGK